MKLRGVEVDSRETRAGALALLPQLLHA
jgi:hypothetical protein